MGVREITEDGFLDGRLRMRQLARGFRSGLDAVMLAAAVPARSGQTVMELGSGAGVASLCVATRVGDCTVIGVELDPELTALANENATDSTMAERVRFVQGDALDLPRELCTHFDHVLCNPPFHGDSGKASPDALRAQALQDSGALSQWLEVGVKRTASNGTFTAILRADRLGEALDALPREGVSVFPLWPKARLQAKRVIVQLGRNARTPFALLPGLVLHDESGLYTREADAVLRGGAALEIAESRR